MLLIILQIILHVFPFFAPIYLYLSEKEKKLLKEDIKTLKKIHERMARIYVVEQPKMYKKEIKDLKEELKQLRQEKWINI